MKIFRLFVASTLICFVLLPALHAVVPPPDGGYPGFNTAEGQKALFSLTSGVANTAVGWYSLFTNTDGSFNTSVGAGTLLFNIGDQNTGQGTQNTAVGTAALLFNTTGFGNSALGSVALQNNTGGVNNTAIGSNALAANITGSSNTAVGASALASNIDGQNTNAFGYQALGALQTGSSNNAFGYYALGANSSGSYNNAFGGLALQFNTGSNNTAVGDLALTSSSGDFNTALGDGAGYFLQTGSNNVYIGDGGFFDESNVIAIGARSASGTPYQNTYIGGIYDTVETDRVVYVGANGHLGTLASSGRYKEEIKPMDKASDALFRLKPVTFRYKKELDPAGIPQFGLVAEDVEKVNPDLVARDDEGKPYTVRYEAVNAMLLNEFLKEHKKTEKLEATVASLNRNRERTG